jgi:hypothetical protein
MVCLASGYQVDARRETRANDSKVQVVQPVRFVQTSKAATVREESYTFRELPKYEMLVDRGAGPPFLTRVSSQVVAGYRLDAG